MSGYYCATKEEALQKALQLIPVNSSVGWGGSMTMEEIGLLNALKKGEYEAIDRTQGDPKEQAAKIFTADYFLMSTNAITRTGELVNIDGASNRLSSLLHGPKHVIIVAGMNKLVKTVEDGFNRIQTSVCPVTAERSGRKTPCGIKGVCTDCQSPDCMCCNIVISRRSRYNGRVKVILVGENLGV